MSNPVEEEVPISWWKAMLYCMLITFGGYFLFGLAVIVLLGFVRLAKYVSG